MLRLVKQWHIFIILYILVSLPLAAQELALPQVGDMPDQSRITILQGEDTSVALVTASAGAVFPNAIVTIRNLYNDSTITVSATSDGSFSASLSGSDETAYWIAATQNRPNEALLAQTNGIILYGQTAQNLKTITQLIFDGDKNDWSGYPQSAIARSIYALRNQESLYLARLGDERSYDSLQLNLQLDDVDYLLKLDLLTSIATLDNLASTRDTLTSTFSHLQVNEISEFRIPFSLPAETEVVMLDTLELSGESVLPRRVFVDSPIPFVDEVDGIAYVNPIEAPADSFYTESELGGNIPRWSIVGRTKAISITSGEDWALELDVTMQKSDTAAIFSDIDMLGEIYLLPLENENGELVGSQTSWTSTRNHIGLPVLGVKQEPILLASAKALSANSFQTDETLKFGLSFHRSLSDEIAEGTYQLLFKGYIQIADSEAIRWEQNPVLLTQINPLPEFSLALPQILTVGDLQIHQAIWAFSPANGVNLVSDNDRLSGGLTEPISLNSSVILPQGNYSLEPKWLNALNMPLDSGNFTISINRPDGKIDLFSADISHFEQTLSDKHLTLSTSSPKLKNYAFDVYGDYEISMEGRVNTEDRVYTGGGIYQLSIAEALHLSPTLLAGTPLEVGDSIMLGAHFTPQFPANVTTRMTIYPLNAEPIVYEVNGQANNFGYFPSEIVTMDVAGEYQIEYIANYTDAEGKLWSATYFTVGIIANQDSSIVAHGQRGIEGYAGVQQAWFNTSIYPSDDINAGQTPHFPYFSGDVAIMPDSLESGLHPVISVQTSADDSLIPLYPDRAYISVVRPDVILRQFIAGGQTSTSFNGTDTFNQAFAAGADGLQSGDYAFLFGGAVMNAESAIYASTLHIVDEDESARVLPPFSEAMNIYGQVADLYFVPTGIRPAQVLTQGERLSLSGQVAPTLPIDLSLTILSPSSKKYEFSGKANKIGYFYSPENDLTLDEIGIWTIEIETDFQGETSSGLLSKPYPHHEQSFEVFVLPPDNPPLGTAEFITATARNPQIYSLPIPEGWTDVQAYATITTASAIISHEELTVFPAEARYNFNPQTIVREHPNLELLDTRTGDNVADVLNLTLVMIGIDANGDFAIRARSYSISHDTTYAVDEAILR